MKYIAYALMIVPSIIALGFFWDILLKGNHIDLAESDDGRNFYSRLKYCFGVGLFFIFIFLPYVGFSWIAFNFLHQVKYGYTLSVFIGIFLGIIFQLASIGMIGSLYDKLKNKKRFW